MSDIVCVTNRKLCRKNFLEQIEEIARAHPRAIILREKDLPERMVVRKELYLPERSNTIENYMDLAKEVLEICKKYSTLCILHHFVEVSKELQCKSIHLPFSQLQAMGDIDRAYFTTLGASCHTVDEAKEAQSLGCTYIIVGHIFETDCKKGLEPRGLSFLQEVCKQVTIPVYAIGGIQIQNIKKVRQAGATGACVMSGLMTCENPVAYLAQMEAGI